MVIFAMTVAGKNSLVAIRPFVYDIHGVICCMLTNWLSVTCEGVDCLGSSLVDLDN
jgi:hypothetical protein